MAHRLGSSLRRARAPVGRREFRMTRSGHNFGIYLRGKDLSGKDLGSMIIAAAEFL
jgi:hypothetical protein